MSGPRRKPSPRVYRRRRQFAAVLALLLMSGLVWAGIAVAALFRPDPAPAAADPALSATDATSAAPEPDGSASPSPTPSPDPTPTEPVCNPADIKVAGSTDAETYAADESPVLILTVTNTGDIPCPINVGTSQMDFLVTSGEDRVFSSRDCQEGAKDLEITLKPGASEDARFAWERIRSAPGCTAVEGVPGPGQYVFQTRLGERISDEVEFTLQ